MEGFACDGEVGVDVVEMLLELGGGYVRGFFEEEGEFDACCGFVRDGLE